MCVCENFSGLHIAVNIGRNVAWYGIFVYMHVYCMSKKS